MVETEEKVKQFILIAIETGRGPLPAETSLSELAQLLEEIFGCAVKTGYLDAENREMDLSL